MKSTQNESEWVKTPYSNLVRYTPSGIYYARVRIRGKLFRKSLDTDSFTTAKLRCDDFIAEKKADLSEEADTYTGKMTVGDCLRTFRERLEAQADISEGAKVYRRKCIETLLKTWPGLESTIATKVTHDDCIRWAARLGTTAKKGASYSPTVYNNVVGTLGMLFDIAIEKRVRSKNPAGRISKKKIQKRHLQLPTTGQFERFVELIDGAGGRFSHHCADLVRFLAYGGFRKTEASFINWADCDFNLGRIHVRITKNGEARFVPMIPDMRALLGKLRAARPEAKPEDTVMKIQECQKAMDGAADKVGMKRITHHDLRHLLATRCIEAGVDIPTVSRWLGHKDGGALAMKTYGHLRDEHSTEMAAKVTFGKPIPANVVAMPKPTVEVDSKERTASDKA